MAASTWTRTRSIQRAANPVLRAEQSHKLYARRVRQQINRAAAVAVDPGLIGDQSNALPRQRREILRLKHINSGQRASQQRMTTDAA